MSNWERQPACSYRGRRIVKIKWEDELIEAVEGMLVFRRKFQEPLDLSRASDALRAEAVACSIPDRLGIGVLTLEGDVNLGRVYERSQQLAEDVLWVEPMMISHADYTPNDTHYPVQWGLKKINAESGWDNYRGRPEKVALAVLDSGIPIENGRLSHPDLNDSARFILGSNLIGGGTEPADDSGHGTHVTGIAAATTNNRVGVAGLFGESRALVIKVMNSNNDVADIDFETAVVEALDYAKDKEVHLVINFSASGYHSKTQQSAAEQAEQEGALLVASVGNGRNGAPGGSIKYPAGFSTSLSNVIAVGAVDQQDNRPLFANYGPEMTVVAPGVDIMSTTPNYYVKYNNLGYQPHYESISGTSQAAPLVSALAAMVWSQWPQLTATGVRQQIINSARSLNGSFDDFGYGIIDAEAALR